ncbi:MAG: SDR family oxidoreductase [Thermoleophilaceae bacterium]
MSAFVTGFPGFLGRRLVAGLAERGPVTCLVHPSQLEQARAAAPANVEVLAGDIAERDLGLSPGDYERVAAATTAVYHLAAIYDLAVPLQIAQSVNVDGTGNVLDLCRRCAQLERLHYVSTAYVAGDRGGVVYEHELALGQAFKNHYESTKFQAEVWVHEEMPELPVTIYRPAIVVGDSRTGETQKFDGPYYMLRVVAFAEARGNPIPQFGRASAPFNVVPVDFVVDALLAGSAPDALGRTFHLVDPEPITALDVLSLLAREYAGREPSYRLPAPLVAESLRIPAVRKLFAGAPRESISYLNHPVRFDTRQATDFLAANGLRCPRFEEYIGPVVAFFREHEDDPAFAPASA